MTAQTDSFLTRWRAEHGPEANGRVGVRASFPASSGSAGSDLYQLMTGMDSGALGGVSESSAMAVSAVYACVSRIGGAVASLPFHIFRKTIKGRERADSPLWWLLNESPASGWTAAAFWTYMIQSRLLHGDAFAIIRRPAVRSSGVAGFDPVHPMNMTVERDQGRLWYRVNDDGVSRVFNQDDVIHVSGVGFDGLRSVSTIRHALRTSAGIALAADEFSSRFFTNGARPDFALTSDQAMKQDQVDQLRTQFADRYQGVANSHRPLLLTNGLRVQPITLNAADAQLLESRKFQIEDICRVFGVPPFMVGHTEKTTSWGSGVESMGIGFVKYTLQMHLTAIEQEFNRKLFKTANNFAEFAVEGLLRADSTARSNYYRAALGGSGGSGWMSVNEVRALENLPEIDGGENVSKWEQTASTDSVAPPPDQQGGSQ